MNTRPNQVFQTPTGSLNHDAAFVLQLLTGSLKNLRFLCFLLFSSE